MRSASNLIFWKGVGELRTLRKGGRQMYVQNCVFGFLFECLWMGLSTFVFVVGNLAEKVANMSATCHPDSQMSSHFAQMPLSRRHNFDPDPFFVSGFANIHQILLYRTRGTYGEFLCKIWSKYLFDIRSPWTFLLLSTPKFKIFAVTRALPT